MPYYCNLSHDGLKLALWCREFVSLYKDRNLCISKTRGGGAGEEDGASN